MLIFIIVFAFCLSFCSFLFSLLLFSFLLLTKFQLFFYTKHVKDNFSWGIPLATSPKFWYVQIVITIQLQLFSNSPYGIIFDELFSNTF